MQSAQIANGVATPLMLAAMIALLLSAAPSVADEAPDMSGAELFRVFCASCHGANAEGDGPVAATLKPEVPDLTRIAARNGGTFPAEKIRTIIDGQSVPRAHGTRAMPVWGWDFYAIDRQDKARRARVAEMIDRLVEHLRSLQRT